jgi:hypothetical protein
VSYLIGLNYKSGSRAFAIQDVHANIFECFQQLPFELWRCNARLYTIFLVDFCINIPAETGLLVYATTPSMIVAKPWIAKHQKYKNPTTDFLFSGSAYLWRNVQPFLLLSHSLIWPK